jgi:glycosyltransferase involved in cell wall biosynthesis
MVFVFSGYDYTPGFNTPESWLERINMYTGALECLGYNHTVYNINQIDYEGSCIHNGVHHQFLNWTKYKTYFPLRLNQFIKNLNPDVVVVQGLHRPLQLIQLRFILPKKTKIIAQHHAEKPFTGIKKIIQGLADRYTDAYLFASKAMGLDWVAKGNLASPEKIHEVMEVSSIFYSIEKSEAKQKTGAIGNPVFLWVGRLNENKDPLNIIKAFLKYGHINHAARLYMIYQTDELLNEIEDLLKRNTHKDAIKLVGQVPHDDLLYWFNSADFLISGSHYEGSGTAVCEAMSCGCIPIVTDIFSFRMITDHGNCGLLYEAGCEAALLAALSKSEKMDMDEMQEKALSYFKANLSFEAIGRRIGEVAESIYI